MSLFKMVAITLLFLTFSEAGLLASSFSVQVQSPQMEVSNHGSRISPNSYITMSIVFQPKNLDLLQILLENHTVLNESVVSKLFVPQEEISSAINYLRTYGISANQTLNVITFSAKASLIEKALHGKVYESNFHGVSYYQFLGDSPFQNAIVTGTNVTASLLSKPITVYNTTQLLAYNEIKPYQLYEAYNVTYLHSIGINGEGTSIGILDFYGDPYIQSQLKAFDSKYNISNPPVFNVVPIGPYNPESGVSSGWALEISLDVEYSHLIAPKAGIYLYVANPNLSLPAILAKIVQDDQVNVLSESFGIPEIYVLLGMIPLSYIQSMEYEYWLGEVEGITFLAASGDAGGTGYNFYLSSQGNLLFPASIPYVLSVGGTTLYVSGNNTLQTAWSGESLFGATTAGVSSIFPSPPYQGSGFLKVPDVAALANPYTGVPVLYYYNISEMVGGTSVATPLTAGIIDLMTEEYGKLGYINPLLYQLKNTDVFGKVDFGYNTPLDASNFNIDGLGYINAGNLFTALPSVLHGKEIMVSTYNTTFSDGEQVTVIAKSNFQTSAMVGEVYNGTSVISHFNLHFNGTYWIGHFDATGSGVYEITVNSGSVTGFSYITVGYQAVFISPEVAIYPEPENIPVIVELTNANGSVVTPFNSINLDIMKYYPENSSSIQVAQVGASISPILNITIFGETFQLNSTLYLGYYNLSSYSKIGGIYEAMIPNVFGMDEFVEGIYVVPAVFPPVATEPLVVSPGQNVTIEVAQESLGSPNITVSFINNDKVMYSTPVNMITYDGGDYYIAQVQMPDIPPGYYTVEAKATCFSSNFTASGVGFTQIYVAPQSLVQNVKVEPSNVLFENDTATIEANITYFNGTPVKFGTFDAILVPQFLLTQVYQDQIVVPLHYDKGEWIGNFTVPVDAFQSSQFGSAGYWNVYLEGTSFNGFPTFSPSTLNVSELEVLPISVSSKIYVLPYIHIKEFKGNFTAYSYISNAVIKNHNATIVDSIVNNLTVINGTVTLVNTNVTHLNDKLGNVHLVGLSSINPIRLSSSHANAPSKLQENYTSNQEENYTSHQAYTNTTMPTGVSTSQSSTSSTNIYIIPIISLLVIAVMIIGAIAILTKKKFS
ncbi:hypothetical protein IC006_0033 [Sulfuracidifex tepidarius]|uniref:Peptidase S53 domain-containing protein n=1 Tax=Sulfuracidifex tepidarius TaxID=1294262 RepID=A0A510DRE1_9CREN|nr:protease pro-enzyme activation domain-containing protein [Sulfuracidifex tepidarius]BBG22749.1 hypothetical protein IC006_0033 [Sulfuracidifex tepidarius]